MKVEILVQHIINQARDSNIDKERTIEEQVILTSGKLAKLIQGLAENDIDAIKSSIGDTMVAIIIGNMIDRKLDIIDICINSIKNVNEGNKSYLELNPLSYTLSILGDNIMNLNTYHYNNIGVMTMICNLIIISKMYNLEFLECVKSSSTLDEYIK